MNSVSGQSGNQKEILNLKEEQRQLFHQSKKKEQTVGKNQARGSVEQNKIYNIYALRVSEREGKRMEIKKYLKKQWINFFPNLANDKNVQLQTAELTPTRINPKESIPGHITVKFLKTRGKKELLKSSERHNTLSIGGNNLNNCISHEALWRPKRNDTVFFNTIVLTVQNPLSNTEGETIFQQ